MSDAKLVFVADTSDVTNSLRGISNQVTGLSQNISTRLDRSLKTAFQYVLGGGVIVATRNILNNIDAMVKSADALGTTFGRLQRLRLTGLLAGFNDVDSLLGKIERYQSSLKGEGVAGIRAYMTPVESLIRLARASREEQVAVLGRTLGGRSLEPLATPVEFEGATDRTARVIENFNDMLTAATTKIQVLVAEGLSPFLSVLNKAMDVVSKSPGVVSKAALGLGAIYATRKGAAFLSKSYTDYRRYQSEITGGYIKALEKKKAGTDFTLSDIIWPASSGFEAIGDTLVMGAIDELTNEFRKGILKYRFATKEALQSGKPVTFLLRNLAAKRQIGIYENRLEHLAKSPFVYKLNYGRLTPNEVASLVYKPRFKDFLKSFKFFRDLEFALPILKSLSSVAIPVAAIASAAYVIKSQWSVLMNEVPGFARIINGLADVIRKTFSGLVSVLIDFVSTITVPFKLISKAIQDSLRWIFSKIGLDYDVFIGEVKASIAGLFSKDWATRIRASNEKTAQFIEATYALSVEQLIEIGTKKLEDIMSDYGTIIEQLRGLNLPEIKKPLVSPREAVQIYEDKIAALQDIQASLSDELKRLNDENRNLSALKTDGLSKDATSARIEANMETIKQVESRIEEVTKSITEFNDKLKEIDESYVEMTKAYYEQVANISDLLPKRGPLMESYNKAKDALKVLLEEEIITTGDMVHALEMARARYSEGVGATGLAEVIRSGIVSMDRYEQATRDFKRALEIESEGMATALEVRNYATSQIESLFSDILGGDEFENTINALKYLNEMKATGYADLSLIDRVKSGLLGESDKTSEVAKAIQDINKANNALINGFIEVEDSLALINKSVERARGSLGLERVDTKIADAWQAFENGLISIDEFWSLVNDKVSETRLSAVSGASEVYSSIAAAFNQKRGDEKRLANIEDLLREIVKVGVQVY